MPDASMIKYIRCCTGFHFIGGVVSSVGLTLTCVALAKSYYLQHNERFNYVDRTGVILMCLAIFPFGVLSVTFSLASSYFYYLHNNLLKSLAIAGSVVSFTSATLVTSAALWICQCNLGNDKGQTRFDLIPRLLVLATVTYEVATICSCIAAVRICISPPNETRRPGNRSTGATGYKLSQVTTLV